MFACSFSFCPRRLSEQDLVQRVNTAGIWITGHLSRAKSFLEVILSTLWDGPFDTCCFYDIQENLLGRLFDQHGRFGS